MTRSDPTCWALLLAFGGLTAAACAEALAHPTSGVTPTMGLGRCLIGLGATLTIYARWLLGRNYAPTAQHPDPDHSLVRRGIYRWFDHPMYAGNLLSATGLLLALDARWSWLTLAPFVAAQAWRVRAEAAYLRSRFGPGWSARARPAPAR